MRVYGEAMCITEIFVMILWYLLVLEWLHNRHDGHVVLCPRPNARPNGSDFLLLRLFLVYFALCIRDYV